MKKTGEREKGCASSI